MRTPDVFRPRQLADTVAQVASGSQRFDSGASPYPPSPSRLCARRPMPVRSAPRRLEGGHFPSGTPL